MVLRDSLLMTVLINTKDAKVFTTPSPFPATNPEPETTQCHKQNIPQHQSDRAFFAVDVWSFQRIYFQYNLLTNYKQDIYVIWWHTKRRVSDKMLSYECN